MAMANNTTNTSQSNLLVETNEIDVIDECSESEDEVTKSSKRVRESSSETEENWTKVTNKKTRRSSNRSENDKYEVYISSKDPLPKQFAMARTLKENNISKICQLKYLSPFKIRIQFENKIAAQSLFDCEELLTKGWKFQKAMELSVSYGIIKNVDLDLTDENVMEYIGCSPPTKLLSLTRLKRKNRDEGGWCPSECIRLCFDGDQLPAFVRVYDINVKVIPYIHQVSQCSLCWKLGHTRRMCPGKTSICPKCGGRHENCDTTSFSCVNCGGDHISLSKTCPTYKKERRIREIMAEFRCTYRKALECYVAPESSVPPIDSVAVDYDATFPPLHRNPAVTKILSTPKNTHQPIITQIAQKKNIQQTPKSQDKTRQSINRGTSRTKSRREKDDWSFWDSDEGNTEENLPKNSDTEEKAYPPVGELLSRLKEVIFLQQVSVSSKVVSILQVCLEWLMLVLKSYISDWPLVKVLLNAIVQHRDG